MLSEKAVSNMLHAEIKLFFRATHELGRADLPVGLDARQCVPGGFMACAQYHLEQAAFYEPAVYGVPRSCAPMALVPALAPKP